MNMKKMIVAALVLMVVAVFLNGCSKQEVPQNNGLPLEGNNGGIGDSASAADTTLPTGNVATIDNEVSQDSVNSEVSDLEKDLQNW